ncbi:hypothetical protein GCM10009127_03020 [Alteraurantiacibacter aestuarii]|uniref:Uncharacterized protein n=1 Tax=Alteraurantiacibacter aestuarii TaxID=650004 RepID=A0A844ZLJ9_9SPHN|nr:hypothetical protein [Alteraurantiacibacter aestuarii]MXO88444.1 hypothetical protein [Alteraurantiacibacter aestuarii]
MLGLIAVGLYAAVALAAMGAALAGHFGKRPWKDGAAWIFASIFMLLLAAMRLTNAEDRIRQFLRVMIKANGEYGHRWEYQAPLTAIVVVLAAAGLVAAFYLVKRWQRQGKELSQTVIAQLAMLGFVPLFGLRIVSLHLTDRLLYAGPLRLNWLIDIGLTLTIGGAAILYILHCKRGAHADARRTQGRRRARR